MTIRHSVCLCFILVILCTSASAQKPLATVRGSVVNKDGGQPLAGQFIALPRLQLLTTTDSLGTFIFSDIPYGRYVLVVSGDASPTDSLTFVADSAAVDLGILPVVVNRLADATGEWAIPQINTEQTATDETEQTDNQQSGGYLNSGQSLLLQHASYIWSAYNFRYRSNPFSSQEVTINGIVMNSPVTGRPDWSQWSGLNDIFRNASITTGIGFAEPLVSGISGSVSYSTNPLEQTKQYKVAYALSNRQYNNRVMVTFHSGAIRGWALSASASYRWAKEGFIRGTAFHGHAWFISLARKWNEKNELQLAAWSSSINRALASVNTEEARQLAGSVYYNSNWGWQQGQVRNARHSASNVPAIQLTHRYRPKQGTLIETTVCLQTGRTWQSALDWYKGADPRPDYYRYLPSWYALTDTGAAALVAATFRSDPDKMQINWEGLYDVNRSNKTIVNNADGIVGNTIAGNRSVYAVAADGIRTRRIAIASAISAKLSEKTSLFGGLSFQSQQQTHFRQLQDLLGGDFFLDYNSFAQQLYPGNADYVQNNLSLPDHPVRVGDIYKYHYRLSGRQAMAQLQWLLSFRAVDVTLSAQQSWVSFQREGLFTNGLFPGTSGGKSEVLHFFPWRLKSTATIKLNGRHFVLVHLFTDTETPQATQVFLSPRTRNQTINAPSMFGTSSIEAGYIYRAPHFDLSTTGYATRQSNATTILRFYNDDPSIQDFVNYAVTDIALQSTGVDCAAGWKMCSGLSAHMAATWNQIFYASHGKVQVVADNDTNTHAQSGVVYIKNFLAGTGPQSVYTLGLHYEGKQNWFIKLSGSTFDRNFVAINPARRTSDAVGMLLPGSEQYEAVFRQEKLPAFFTLDLSAGKSFRIRTKNRRWPANTSIYVSLAVNNILHNQRMRTGGFEQLRYDFSGLNPARFPNKYTYAPGTNFFINLSIKY